MYNLTIHNMSTGMSAFPTGGQTNATRLVSDINTINIVTNSGDSVKLPEATQGYSISVKNSGLNTLHVFPYEGDYLSGNLNAYQSLLVGQSYTFNSFGNNWDSNLVVNPYSNVVTPSASLYSLGVASGFTVLTGGTITAGANEFILSGNTGEGTLTNPTNIVFGSGTNSGVSTAAVSAANTLYNQLVALTASQISVSTDITASGLTAGRFIPGVYSFSNALDATADQTITLYGDGDYVFNVVGAVTTGANFEMVLMGGAHASRIFFTSGGAFTFGANNILSGSFLTNFAFADTGASTVISGGLYSTLVAAISIGAGNTLQLPN
jgi:hypothetical protein